MINLNANINSKAVQITVAGKTLDVQAEAVQSYSALVEAVAEIRKISFDAAALMIYQIAVSTHNECRDIWERGKHTTWVKRTEGSTSAKSDTSDAAKEKHSH